MLLEVCNDMCSAQARVHLIMLYLLLGMPTPHGHKQPSTYLSALKPHPGETGHPRDRIQNHLLHMQSADAPLQLLRLRLVDHPHEPASDRAQCSWVQICN